MHTRWAQAHMKGMNDSMMLELMFPPSPVHFPPRFHLRLQGLEQGRHELRLKLEGCQSQWESQVGELERDARELSAQVEQLTRALSEAERDKGRLQLEHGEQTQRLREELRTVSLTQRSSFEKKKKISHPYSCNGYDGPTSSGRLGRTG